MTEVQRLERIIDGANRRIQALARELDERDAILRLLLGADELDELGIKP